MARPQISTIIESFPAEEADGLADLVRSTASVSVASQALPNPDAALPENVLAHLRATATDLSLPDLYPLTFILASTGINRNDDFFDREETWASRDTPADKPFNYQHDAGDPIGHMLAGAAAVGLDGTVLAADAEAPASFHIKAPAVLYRHWPGCVSKQERADAIIAAIDNPPDGEPVWYVSMECRFKGFDYVLVPGGPSTAAGAANEPKVLPRSADTAFLTKHLRAYGGTGLYKGYKLGRVLRNITFSGVGLVKNPANPASVILTAGTASAGVAENISHIPDESGYVLINADTKARASEAMNETEKKLAQAEKDRDEAQAKLKDFEAKAAATAAAELATKVAELTASKDAAKAEADAAKAALAKVEAALVEAQKVAETATAELAKQAESAKHDKRLALVKAAYGFAGETAEADATAATVALKALADDAFDAHLTAMTKVKRGETKVTDLPAPMGGGSKKVVGDATLPTTPVPAGATVVKVATAGALDAAVATETEGDQVALNVTTTGDDTQSALAAEMLEFFGKADEEEPEAPAPKVKAKSKTRK